MPVCWHTKALEKFMGNIIFALLQPRKAVQVGTEILWRNGSKNFGK
jgi:hypothetical protein